MGFSEFTFKLILIFIPGIIAFIIIDNATVHKETKTHHWVVYSLLLGFLSYLPVTLYKYFKFKDEPIIFLEFLNNAKSMISFGEILVSSFAAIIIGSLLTYVINKKIFHKILKKLGISNKFPEIDAWANLNNLYNPTYITIRNLENNLIYTGILVASSDANDRDGIILQDVEVYDERDGEKLYETKVIFIPQKMEKLIIEIHEDDNKEENDNKEEGVVKKIWEKILK